MRFLLALCVVVGCTLCGSAMAGAMRRRVRLLESLSQGLRVLRLHMVSMFEPVQQGLRASGCDVLTAVADGMTPGVSAREAWARVLRTQRRRGGGIDALNPEDIAVLNALFEQLGESGRDQQDILLTGTCAALERQIAAARKRTDEADKLYVSLGALTGLMIALVLI